MMQQFTRECPHCKQKLS